jgi:hypothetical protein
MTQENLSITHPLGMPLRRRVIHFPIGRYHDLQQERRTGHQSRIRLTQITRTTVGDRKFLRIHDKGYRDARYANTRLRGHVPWTRTSLTHLDLLPKRAL